VHEHDRLRRRTGCGEDFLLRRERIAEDHRRSRKIPEHELVALLGNRRRRGDIDDQRDTLLLGSLGDGGGLPGIESADQKLRTVPNQLFRPSTRGLDVRFGIGVRNREIGHTQRLQDRRRDVDAQLTTLTDAGLQTGARQLHADFERSTLSADDIERRDAGNERGSARAGGKVATGDAR
jgi:hypothetical protein